jgi:hypothetical protein
MPQNLKESFTRLPRLAALYKRLMRASQEQSGMVIVSERPFLVDRSGILYYGVFSAPWFVFSDDIEGDESVLYHELESIARGLQEGRYKRAELGRLEKWSRQIKRAIDVAVPFVDSMYAQELAEDHLLH